MFALHKSSFLREKAKSHKATKKHGNQCDCRMYKFQLRAIVLSQKPCCLSTQWKRLPSCPAVGEMNGLDWIAASCGFSQVLCRAVSSLLVGVYAYLSTPVHVGWSAGTVPCAHYSGWWMDFHLGARGGSGGFRLRTFLPQEQVGLQDSASQSAEHFPR